MSNTTRNTEKEYRFCVVEGGHDADPDPERAGRVRLRDVARHGKNVKTEHLPWSQLISNPQGQGQNEFNRPPDPGQLVLCIVPRGAGTTGYKHVVGIPISKEMADASIPGNQSFPWNGTKDFKREKLKINVAPNVKLKDDNGKMIYELQEKGEKFYRALADELPGHLASKPLFNNVTRQLKNTPTAIQQAQAILSPEMISQLPGSNFSFSNILEMMPQETLQNLPESIQTALQNITVLSSSSDDNAGQVNTGYRVNDEVFSQNLGQLFGNVQNYAQLEDALGTLHQGSDVTGMAMIDSLTQMITGPFGDLEQIIDSLGNVTINIPDETQNAQESFTSLINNVLSGGGKLFGDDTKIPNDLLSRFPAETQNQFKTMLEKVSPSSSDKRGRIHNQVSGLQETLKNFSSSNPVFDKKISFFDGKS